MSLCRYKVEHRFKISEHKKEELSISFYPASIDLLLQSSFIFSPRNLDLDRLRQPYQATEWHNLYYMHGDSGERVSVERIWWVNGKELCLIWDGSCSVHLHHVVNLPATVGSVASEDSKEHDHNFSPCAVNKECFHMEPTSRTTGSHEGCQLDVSRHTTHVKAN